MTGTHSCRGIRPRRLGIALLSAAFALSIPSARAQTVYGAAFTTPDGYELTGASPGYDAANETFYITGVFTIGLTDSPLSFGFSVQRRNVTVTGIGGGMYVFEAFLPMGYTITPPFGGWSLFTFGGALSDPNRIAKPIVAELSNSSGEVIARDKIIIFDKRYNSGLESKSGRGKIFQSMGMEITRQGLNKLEELHKQNLPQPGVSSFGTVLTGQFRGYNRSVVMDTTPSNNSGVTPKACVPLLSAPSMFRQLSDFGLIQREAQLQYWTYQAADEQLNAGAVSAATSAALGLLLGPAAIGPLLGGLAQAGAAQAVLDRSCVREWPTENRFEVCAGSIRGDAESLSLAGIQSTDLDLGAAGSSPPQLTASTNVGALNGTVTGSLRNIFLRYAENANTSCVVRPRRQLSETTVASNSTLNLWRTCSGLGLSVANSSMSAPGTYEFAADTDPERNLLSLYAAPNPVFVLGGNRSTDPAHGVCARLGFRHNAQTLLGQFYGRAQTALNNAWLSGNPQTQEAAGLDLIFSRWETGIYGDSQLANSPTGVDHRLTHEYSPSRSENLNDRLWVKLNTDAKVLGYSSPATWLFTEPGVFPCSTSTWGCLNGRSAYGQPFDVSYTITTSALNQVLKELSQTPLLTFQFEPTYAQLGATPPPGTPSTAKAPLNGVTLSALNPAFAALGNNTATIMVRPTYPPYTYINPQPPLPRPDAGRSRLTLTLPSFQIELRTAATSPLGDNVWLLTEIDHYEPDLNLTLHSNPLANVLVPVPSGALQQFNVVTRNGFFGACNMSFAGTSTIGCADALGNSLASLIMPGVRENLLYMLSRFPFPRNYDSGGTSSYVRPFLLQDTYKEANAITFYGTLQ